MKKNKGFVEGAFFISNSGLGFHAPNSHNLLEIGVFLVYASFGFGNILSIGMDRAHQIRPPCEISAQTDQRCPSYDPSTFCQKWLCLDQFFKNLFFQNGPNKRYFISILYIFFFMKIFFTKKTYLGGLWVQNYKSAFLEVTKMAINL